MLPPPPSVQFSRPAETVTHALHAMFNRNASNTKQITSVLVLTQLSTELADPDGNGGTVSILLGLDVEEFTNTIVNDARQHEGPDFSKEDNFLHVLSDFQNSDIIMVSFLLFSMVYAVASAILIWGTIVEKSWCALPWLICEAFSFATQIATLALHAIALRARRDTWVIIVSILNICVTVYFWLVVFCAQRTWSRQRRESKANEESLAQRRHNSLPEEELPAPPLPSKKYVQV